MKDFNSVSPLKILEKSSLKGLGAGNLGVLIARAGVGKTACLIHISFDKLLRNQKLVHISLGEGPEKVTSYYNVIYYDLIKALEINDDYEYRMLIDRNRMILSYLNRSFDVARLRSNLKNLSEKLDFIPEALIIDGINFEKADRELFTDLKKIAEDFKVEIWLSALSHRHITEVSDSGVPYPCNRLDDFFNIIIQLQPEQSGIFLKLLKDHGNPVANDARVKLDPNTFFVLDSV